MSIGELFREKEKIASKNDRDDIELLSVVMGTSARQVDKEVSVTRSKERPFWTVCRSWQSKEHW